MDICAMNEVTNDKKPSSAAGAGKAGELKLDLRNTTAAGFLTWLCPGAGHFYQRRYFKAAIYGLSVWILMISGLMMGSYRAPRPNGEGGTVLHFARVVYCSWRPGDRHVAFIPQACVGVMAIPSLLQARRHADADGSFWSCAFMPPKIPADAAKRPNQPTLNEIAANLNSWLDLATLYTVVAGFLNLLAIFDAVAGPTIPEEDEEKKKPRKYRMKKCTKPESENPPAESAA